MTEEKKDLGKSTAAKLSGAEDEVKAETGDATDTVDITVEVRGTEVTLTCPASFEEADPDVIIYMEQEKPSSAFKELIGDGQWKRMKSLKWRSSDFTRVVEKWSEAVGLGNG